MKLRPLAISRRYVLTMRRGGGFGAFKEREAPDAHVIAFSKARRCALTEDAAFAVHGSTASPF